METTDSLSLIFLIYVAQAAATCSFVIFPLSQESCVGFSLLIYSNVSNSRNTIYSSLLFAEVQLDNSL